MSEGAQQDLLGQLTYSEAERELRTILDEIEHDSVDLDELASKVDRAAALIQLCRERIEHTEMRVRRVIEQLDDEDDA